MIRYNNRCQCLEVSKCFPQSAASPSNRKKKKNKRQFSGNGNKIMFTGRGKSARAAKRIPYDKDGNENFRKLIRSNESQIKKKSKSKNQKKNRYLNKLH